MSIGILVIDIICKEISMGFNVFGPRGNLLWIGRIYASHIFFKSGVLNLAVLESFIQMC